MFRRDDGRWQQSVKVDGKWKVVTAKTQAKLIRKLKTIEDKNTHGMTFNEVAELFEQSRFDSLAPGSLVAYRPALKYAQEYFGDDYVAEIKPKDIAKYLASLTNRFADKTISNYRTMVNQVFVFAISELGLDIQNPCLYIKSPPSKIKAEVRQPLTHEQRAEIDSTLPSEFLLPILIVNTGARLGEACALQWEDINFDDNIIHITKAIHWDGNRPYVGGLKTENGYRDVPLLSPLRTILLETPQHRKTDYVVSGSEPLTMSQLERRWIKFCIDHNMARPEGKIWKTHGVERKHIKWMCDINRHQLRHEFATSLFRANVPVKAVQHLLGHSDYSTTMDIYVHWQSESLEATRETIEQYISEHKKKAGI